MRYGFYKDKVNLTGYTETLEGKIKEFQEVDAEKEPGFKINRKSKHLMNKIRRPNMSNVMDTGHIIRNVHYFDQTDGMDLPEEKVELLNSKIKHITDEYNARLLNLNNRNRQLLEDFTKLKIMCGDEFSDMDIKSQVSKTLILTTDASLIWNEFNA